MVINNYNTIFDYPFRSDLLPIMHDIAIRAALAIMLEREVCELALSFIRVKTESVQYSLLTQLSLSLSLSLSRFTSLSLPLPPLSLIRLLKNVFTSEQF